METTRIQLRGHCPCCARIQAVVSGTMSKHGYTVENGWFEGVCSGDRYAPIEVDRRVADGVVSTVRAQAAELRVKAAAYASGELLPTTVKARFYDGKQRCFPQIAWEAADAGERSAGVSALVFKLKHRADAGDSFANQLAALIERVHGQPLLEVPVAAAPAPVQVGDKRQSRGGVLCCTHVLGARVYWTMERNGSTYRNWTGIQAWRKLPVA